MAQRARLDKDLAKADHPVRIQPKIDDTLSGSVSVADPSSSVSRYNGGLPEGKSVEGWLMVAVDVELLLHYGVRLFMREEGMSADQAFDTAVLLLVALRAQDTRDPDEALELVMDSLLLPELRERILPAYRKPNPDLSDLGPVIQAEKEAAARAQRQRRRRRQLGSRP